MNRRPPRSPLFPNTTLFRSRFVSDVKAVMDPEGTWIVQMSYLPLMLRSEEHTSELQSRLHLLCPLFFLNEPATTEISPLPQHDALPISVRFRRQGRDGSGGDLDRPDELPPPDAEDERVRQHLPRAPGVLLLGVVRIPA